MGIAAEYKEYNDTKAVTSYDFDTELVNEIFEGEGTGLKQSQAKGFESGYDVPYDYGSYYMPKKPLSTMTVKEVKEFQRRQINRTAGTLPETDQGTGAVGKYQVVQGTLNDQQRILGFKDTDLFDKRLQDRIGVSLLEKRGLKDFKSGKISQHEFQSNLSHEWASIANPDTGKSRYGQATGTSLEEMQAVFKYHERQGKNGTNR